VDFYFKDISPLQVYSRVGGSYSYILESAAGGEKMARYSILGFNPLAHILIKDGDVKVKSWSKELELEIPKHKNPLKIVEGVVNQLSIKNLSSRPRFNGGWVGYLSYDVVPYLHPLSLKAKNILKQPDAEFLLTQNNIIFDHLARRLYLLGLVFGSEQIEKMQSYLLKLQQEIKEKCGYVNGDENEGKLSSNFSSPSSPLKSNLTKEQFKTCVKKAKEYIKNGDILQVVLSQRFEVPFGGKPIDIYRILRAMNPSPYMYFLDFGKRHVIGASPEMLVRVEGNQVWTYPIAGTRPRGKTQEEDERLAEELLEDEKECAEHLMLVDLGRNDIGKVARYGSVEVSKFMQIEKYSHVQHMVSEVRGELKEGVNCFDALAAIFPAGTVTGAPKVRAMEIIDELESERRGIYAGCVGYFGFNGNMDSAITIRTVIVERNKAYVQAGAGIVADSIPEKEYEECLNKARALLNSVEKAQCMH